MPLPPGPHRDVLTRALAIEAEGHRALLAGEDARGAQAMLTAARLYRESWELAPPQSYGRLIGMLKAAVIGGEAERAARYARSEIHDAGESAPAHYALAIAALVLTDDAAAGEEAAGMSGASPAFGRAADAVAALAQRDQGRYSEALAAIVADFASRDQHLTGVRIADTALMLELLAEVRGMALRPRSSLLPARC